MVAHQTTPSWVHPLAVGRNFVRNQNRKTRRRNFAGAAAAADAVATMVGRILDKRCRKTGHIPRLGRRHLDSIQRFDYGSNRYFPFHIRWPRIHSCSCSRRRRFHRREERRLRRGHYDDPPPIPCRHFSSRRHLLRAAEMKIPRHGSHLWAVLLMHFPAGAPEKRNE